MPQMCEEIFCYSGTGANYKLIHVNAIYGVFHPDKAAALPGLHELCGSDQNGTFATDPKPSWWSVFKNADHSVLIAAFGNQDMSQQMYSHIEKSVHQIYIHWTPIT